MMRPWRLRFLESKPVSSMSTTMVMSIFWAGIGVAVFEKAEAEGRMAGRIWPGTQPRLGLAGVVGETQGRPACRSPTLGWGDAIPLGL